ncbi:wall-associated receptor kinase-like 10 isoform X1 [Corylus avellana]|uniref:wall-associated receptor kinase-like 10 isoform X1 n=1 Tax=Corylus avellana TaxID=13451 RepID=UPI001E236CE5|nr:wall-associated receptor kinase-like 10 isoform X1 [Corylus avellana]
MVVRMVFQSILLLFSIYAFVQAAGFSISSCQPSCGDVNLKYPFGIGAGCYADAWFEVVCRNDSLASPSPKPFLRILNLEVLDISLDGTVRVNFPTVYNCTNGTSSTANIVELRNSPFIFSQSENKFIALGCNNFASMRSVDGSGSAIGGCMSICDTTKVVNASSCNIGINCCQASIPSDLDAFNTTMEVMNSKDLVINGCNSAFLVEEKWFKTDYRTLSLFVPVVLEWWIPYTSFISLPIANYNTSSTYNCRQVVVKQRNTTFTCSCKAGYGGNPYVPGACHVIKECELTHPCLGYNPSPLIFCENTYNEEEERIYTYNGSYICYRPIFLTIESRVEVFTIGISSGLGLLVLLVGGWWSYKVVKKRRMIKQKNKFFKRNGGLLLRQQLSSHEANVENIKLFNSKELEKATDRFNVNRVLGQGGQGTVYKGMLIDGRIVAVKKSKVIDEGKLGEFINEVVILSQINHRNVVKLIGCCLETEVPLLVYEYVPNGTLFQYFNGQTEEFPLTWDMRLRIATEVAGALFYLHSAASTPIYHRDIKSTNILLDDKFRAKVADFGTSRSIAVDQTHLTTRVHGTFGYLDPEYFQSSQFTEKSDVYSFGVVLAELLTGEKAISSTKTQEPRSLATYFIQSVEENSLFDIIDSRVLKEGKKEEIIAVANLAKRCLNLNGKKRPTMREVTIELQAVQMLQKGANLQQNYEELEYVGAEVYELWDAAPTSIVSTASIDAQPLL